MPTSLKMNKNQLMTLCMYAENELNYEEKEDALAILMLKLSENQLSKGLETISNIQSLQNGLDNDELNEFQKQTIRIAIAFANITIHGKTANQIIANHELGKTIFEVLKNLAVTVTLMGPPISMALSFFTPLYRSATAKTSLNLPNWVDSLEQRLIEPTLQHNPN